MDSKKNSFIFILLRTFICFILILLFSSCAIHWKFPFICFEKACLADQWHIRDIKASIKKMKGNSNKRQQKRNAKRRKEGGKETDTNIDSEVNLKDSNDVALQDSSVNDKYRLSLSKADTMLVLLVFHPGDSIEINDQLILKKYINRIKNSNISEITIKEFSYATDKSEYKERMKRLKEYFNKYGIYHPKLIILRRSKIENDKTDRRIEVRIK